MLDHLSHDRIALDPITELHFELWLGGGHHSVTHYSTSNCD
jgi:hypothetical protein